MSRPEARLAWTGLLGPPTIWFVHFGFVYAAASLEIVLRGHSGLLSRVAIGTGTLAALALIGWIGWRAELYAPHDDQNVWRFWVAVLRTLAAVSGIGILYQALPAVMV